MLKYNKIETLYSRDTEGTKKLIEGVFRNPAVKFLKDNEWEFTEKIDGTNIRIYWDGHKVYFGGRTDNASIPSHLQNRLDELFGTNETEQLFEQLFNDKEVYLFGEGYGPKINKGGAYRDSVDFILFDVMINGNYQPRKTVEEIARAFGLDVVPIIMRGTLQQAVDFVKTNPDSTIGTAKMEGLVGKPRIELNDRCGNRVIVKIKFKDFN